MSSNALSDMPENWKLTTIGGVCEPPQYGYTTKASSSGDLRLLRTTDITKGSIDWDSVPYCTENPDDIEKYLLKDGDIVISRAGSVGVSYLLTSPEKSVFASYLIRFRPKINKKFFRYFLDSPFYWGGITENKLGIAVPNVNATKLKGIPFPLPPENEQRDIVAKIETLFSELDKGIESLKAARQQLKTYRQAVLKHAFEGKLTEQWRQQNPDKLETPEQLRARMQQEREQRYQQQLEEWRQAVKAWQGSCKEGKKPAKPKINNITQLSEQELSLLSRLPEGYIYTYLANLGELGRGKSKHRPRNDKKLFGGIWPFLQTAEVKAANRVITSFEQTYSDFGLSQSKLWPKGTLCITIAANIAETAFLGIDACFPDSVVGFSANQNTVIPEYVELFIKAVRVRLEAYAPATAQKNINLKTLENLVIPYCSVSEQEEIVAQLEAIFSVVGANEKEVEDALVRTESLRQSILNEAFSGQLTRQDFKEEATDTASSVALE